MDDNISIATVYRTVRLFEEAGLLGRHDLAMAAHGMKSLQMITTITVDVHSGKVIEFHDEEVEELQRKIAAKHGFKLVDHRMELYGVPLEDVGDS